MDTVFYDVSTISPRERTELAGYNNPKGLILVPPTWHSLNTVWWGHMSVRQALEALDEGARRGGT